MEITIDASGLNAFLDDFQRRQAPFALSNALNDTAKLFQYRQQQHDRKFFKKARRQDWLDRNVKITKFSTKRDLTAEVAIRAPGNDSRSDILGKFETQTEKRPRGKSLAVPLDVKRTTTDIIAQSMRPKAFNFKRVGGKRAVEHGYSVNKNMRGGIGRGALEVYEGDKRTVMIQNAQGKGVVLQRVGRGKRAAMRVLYILTPRAKLDPKLMFIENAKEAVTHFADFFRARFAEAMSTAKR